MPTDVTPMHTKVVWVASLGLEKFKVDFIHRLCTMAKRKPSSRVDLSIVQKVAKLEAYHALTPEFKKGQRTAAEKLGMSHGGLRN